MIKECGKKGERQTLSPVPKKLRKPRTFIGFDVIANFIGSTCRVKEGEGGELYAFCLVLFLPLFLSLCFLFFHLLPYFFFRRSPFSHPLTSALKNFLSLTPSLTLFCAQILSLFFPRAILSSLLFTPTSLSFVISLSFGVRHRLDIFHLYYTTTHSHLHTLFCSLGVSFTFSFFVTQCFLLSLETLVHTSEEKRKKKEKDRREENRKEEEKKS